MMFFSLPLKIVGVYVLYLELGPSGGQAGNPVNEAALEVNLEGTIA